MLRTLVLVLWAQMGPFCALWFELVRGGQWDWGRVYGLSCGGSQGLMQGKNYRDACGAVLALACPPPVAGRPHSAGPGGGEGAGLALCGADVACSSAGSSGIAHIEPVFSAVQ